MEQKMKTTQTPNPLFPFMAIGSGIYAFFFTIFLYQNNSGITYPFFVGGTCLFFCFYLKKSGITAKKGIFFFIISLLLLGISTCLTDSWCLHFFNKLGILLLTFCMVLYSLYDDRTWDFSKYLSSICNIIATSIVFIFQPFTDFRAYLMSKNKEEKQIPPGIKYISFGLLISLPLLLVVMILLASADIVFANIFDKLFFNLIENLLDFLLKENIIFITFMLLFGFFAPYCILSRLNLRNIKEETEDKRTGEPIIAITFTAVLSLVYLVFSAIQVIYLFAGFGTLPYDYTYAEYAREGFFQLVFVCLINLILVLTCMKRFRKNAVLKGLLTFISVCTYIMIASSAYKMLLYINCFYLTFLRVFVLWALFVIFILITGVLIFIYKESFPYFKFSLVAVTLLYLMFSFSRPDYWIAKYNVSHYNADSLYTGYTDMNYLVYNLSADAAPVLYSAAVTDFHPDTQEKIKNNPPKKVSFRTWNLSRWMDYQYYQDFISVSFPLTHLN